MKWIIILCDGQVKKKKQHYIDSDYFPSLNYKLYNKY